MSAQADHAGYRCSPARRLDTLEEYDTVEVVIYGPFQMAVDPTTMEIPGDVLAKFTSPEEDGVAIGCYLTMDDISKVELAIARASLNPNAGIPRGTTGWAGRRVFHGASEDDAHDIEENGISMTKSSKGYFGEAFYVAEEEELARSNYAEFSDDENDGAVLEFVIAHEARILDLRNSKDAEKWQTSGLERHLGEQGLAGEAVRKGIDGVYDRSVGGLAIYNPDIIRCLGMVSKPSGELTSSPP
ncbi:hypothetical protein [Roseibium sp. RKSG952]|uniref:hypothetical protein n=1 Tax=Roseibium sp. RKSG952 TaxID=2529384 RepID=UPI0012BCF8E6|nr:hypothetical protein [Roseibium sp. RKSG952]MTH94691.1 hypothetical protein [Roseibium sp. RKSG952]